MAKFYFDSTQDSKRNKQKCNFHYAVMSMMMSQILQFVDFTKTQKLKYLDHETLFLL